MVVAFLASVWKVNKLSIVSSEAAAAKRHPIELGTLHENVTQQILQSLRRSLVMQARPFIHFNSTMKNNALATYCIALALLYKRLTAFNDDPIRRSGLYRD
jgi:hypothetical protein